MNIDMLSPITGNIIEKINEHIEQLSTSLSNPFNRTEEDKYTFLHYARSFRATFEEEPFNEVDSLILSWISYLRIPEEILPVKKMNTPDNTDEETYDGTGKKAVIQESDPNAHPIFSDTSSCRIRDFLKAEYFPDMLRDIWSPDDTLEMLYAMALNPRFENMHICMRREETDHANAKQFAAFTIQLTPNLTYVAFRGTDKSITGWEEDLRLCLTDPVPSQTLAAEYLQMVGQVFRGNLIIGGHSKGGNLAVYAAANCELDVQERIQEVYTHDGPGFLLEDLEKDGFRRIQSRIRKTAPQFSIFGMLLRQEAEPKIIYSYEKGIMQHNAASWKVDGNSLSEYWYPDKASQVLKNKLNNWVDGLSNEEKEQLINTVFRILDQTGHERFGDLKTNMTEIVPVVLRELSKLDPSMQKFLFDMIRQFVMASEENRDPLAEPPVKTDAVTDTDSEAISVTDGQEANNIFDTSAIPVADQKKESEQNVLKKFSEEIAKKAEASIEELMRKYDSM